MKLTSAVLVGTLALPLVAYADEKVVMIEGASHKIPTTITLPEGNGPFPFVLMYHGTGSNRHEAGGGYDMLAPKLAEAGIASARLDFAGTGDSEVSYTEYSIEGGVQDGMAVVEYMKGLDQIAGDRLGVMGWSQGGYVALVTAARNPEVKSTLTWAGVYDMKESAQPFYDEAKANGFAVREMSWRSPLHMGLAWFEDVFSIDLPAELEGYKGALFAINGSKDSVVAPKTAGEIVEFVSTAEPNKSFIMEGADHTFNIFTDDKTNFDELVNLTIGWFEDTL